ncbi:MAG: hypothetical protein IPM74_01305 [Crocinitomicaceae bacterium]|nr:hypothetical protein [Crocinitomicaceae bacterium]MBK8924554.1 hypothetical protein [Crocinitomicaceae bacterium]
MKTLIEIFPKARTGSYIWEHILKTVMGLCGGFGLIFFTLFLIGGRSKNDSALKLIVYLFADHIEVTLAICFCFAIILNIIAVYRNKKKIYIRKIEMSDNLSSVRFSMISVYSDEEIQVDVPIINLQIFESKIKELFIGSHKVISFSDLDHKAFGMIDPQHEIHRKEMYKFKPVLQNIRSRQSEVD